MSRTVSPSTGRPYGLARVARTWAAPRATIYRHRARAADGDVDVPPPVPTRPGPVGPCPDAELAEHIRG